jgi:DNA-binding CsgD family transcriptional regulator
MQLTEEDKELVSLVAVGFTDDEITTQLHITKHELLNHIARLLAKLDAKDRVEIVLYAYSDPAMSQWIRTKVNNRSMNPPQPQTPKVKSKVS